MCNFPSGNFPSLCYPCSILNAFNWEVDTWEIAHLGSFRSCPWKKAFGKIPNNHIFYGNNLTLQAFYRCFLVSVKTLIEMRTSCILKINISLNFIKLMTQLPVISNYLMRSSFYPLIKFFTSLKYLLSIKLHTISISLQVKDWTYVNFFLVLHLVNLILHLVNLILHCKPYSPPS